jgi:hypothetical protein
MYLPENQDVGKFIHPSLDFPVSPYLNNITSNVSEYISIYLKNSRQLIAA